MSSIVVTIKTARADVASIVGSGGKETVQRVVKALEGGLVGAHDCRVDAQYSTSNPVSASGTITLSSVPADDTVTIGTATLTAKASPSGENQFSQAGTDAADATALAAKINAHSVLSKIVTASAASNVVTVTCKVKGPIGNQIGLSETGTSMTVSGTTLAGGAGGAESAPVAVSLGL